MVRSLRSFQGNVSLTFRPEPETQPDAVDQQQEQDKTQRGARTAENIRYGQAISEGGMGGKTTEAGGSANQGLSNHGMELPEPERCDR